MTENFNYDQPIEIAKDIFWVGKRGKYELEMNVYLRIFKGNGKQVNMLIDPGPESDFEAIASKVEQVLGSNGRIHISFINHQDPDVGMNAVAFQRYYPGMQVITTEDTWRLIRFFGLDPKRYIPVDKFKTGKIRLITGHELTFVPTPYCHFRGACAIYDNATDILFSGDLFGGLTDTPELYAEENFWEGIKIFHQIYMPTKIALQNAVKNIREKVGEPSIIAPQHGRIIKDKLVNDFIARMDDFEVGLDLLQGSSITSKNFLNAMNDIITRLEKQFGEEYLAAFIKKFDSDGTFPQILNIKNKKIINVKVGLEEAFQLFLSALISGASEEEIRKLKFLVLDTLIYWRLDTRKFSIENIDEKTSDFQTVEEEQEEVDISGLINKVIDKAGGKKFARLTTLKIMLKIPPKTLQDNGIKSYEDLLNLKTSRDPALFKYLTMAVNSLNEDQA